MAELKIHRRPKDDVEDCHLISQTNNPTDDFVDVPLSNPTADSQDTFAEQDEGAYNPTDDGIQEEGTNDDNNPGDISTDSGPSEDPADEEEEEKKAERADDAWANERGFRVFNDLESEIWIRLKIKTSTWVVGVGAIALIGVTAGAGAAAVATYGAAAAATEASLSLTAAVAASTSTVATVTGLMAGGWNVVGAVSSAGAVALGAKTDKKGMKAMIARGEKFKNDPESERISPGDYYEYKGYWNRNVQVLADGIIYQQILSCQYGKEYHIEQGRQKKAYSVEYHIE